jgi:hypothetical protein
MERRQVGRMCIRLDAQHTALIGCEHQIDAPVAGELSQFIFHCQIVTLIDQQIQITQISASVFPRDSVVTYHDLEVGIDLRNTSGGKVSLVHTQVIDSGAQPVEVREIKAIEVS